MVLKNVIMPKLGLTMTYGTVSEWHKKPGDHFEKGEVLCQVETEKIVDDVPAPCNGTMYEILVQAGEDQEVLKPICSIVAD